jgi:hypothetical protein
MQQIQQYPGQLARTVSARRATGRASGASAANAHAAGRPRRTRCRIGVHRAPSARTAMSHGDSAAAHHICASLHSGAWQRAHLAGAFVRRRALCGGVLGAIHVDMARCLR